ncbi:MAG: ribosome assembly RNA-binding protein YhbY [Deltaproteobacteria bacterium]|nr:ribosome assembly RNA-binding protein YhbY [Deltaproteobacteria bacterium]
MELTGAQKKTLRGMAHSLKPIVHVGQRGVTESLVANLDQALDDHELVKVRFVEHKDKEDKKRIAAELEQAVSASMVGMKGHTAIFFRQHPDPEKRKIPV